MEAWLVWLIVATSAASLADIFISSSLAAGIRERWEVHWLWRVERALFRADLELGMLQGRRDPRSVAKLRDEIEKRASEEAGVPLWYCGSRRKKARPYSAIVRDLDRIASYSNYASCVECLPFLVFLLSGIVGWLWLFGLETSASELFTGVVHVPVPFWLLGGALTLKWVFPVLHRVLK
jgi:hypothetical protein